VLNLKDFRKGRKNLCKGLNSENILLFLLVLISLGAFIMLGDVGDEIV